MWTWSWEEYKNPNACIIVKIYVFSKRIASIVNIDYNLQLSFENPNPAFLFA